MCRASVLRPSPIPYASDDTLHSLALLALRNEGSEVEGSIATIPFRITSFTDPHLLTPIESHLYKKQGRGYAKQLSDPSASSFIHSE
jgi:hypothetical protein